MLKRLFVKLSVFVIGLIIICLFFAAKKSTQFQRDPVTLMNQYYRYKHSNPIVAKQALYIILKQDSNNLPTMIELSQWLVSEKQYHEALPLLQRIHERLPSNKKITYQLGYSYFEEGLWENATQLFKQYSVASSDTWNSKMNETLMAMGSFLPTFKDESQIVATNSSPIQPVKSTFLPSSKKKVFKVSTGTSSQSLKESNKRRKIQSNEVTALKEAGYLALRQHQFVLALDDFLKAYELTYDPNLAMQIGYLYNQLQQNQMAYRYFQWTAWEASDSALALRAENALTNLKGEQTKLWSLPYFGEFFAMPFTQSRFGLTVNQYIGRLGVELPTHWKTRVYTFNQLTDDNQSKAAQLGKISEIYEDDVNITGLGVQISPLKHIPIIMYGEMGAAYDLVYRDRKRWRSDFRGGLMYYQEFGQKPAFYSKPTWSHEYYSNWYGDFTYYSRYNNNVIGLLKTHQGIRLLQYKSSMLNAYARGLVVQDTQRLFYNNYAEIGPGVGFIPSNRYNFEIRFDYIKGTYLPAGAIANPYHKTYTNKLLQLFLYIKI